MLSLESIRAAQRAKWKTVNVPEWGGDVLLRPLGVADFIALSSEPDTSDGKLQFIRNVIAACAMDAHGKPLFGGDGADVLNQVGRDVLIRLVNIVLELSGLNEQKKS